MARPSRRLTREYLVQALYARSIAGSFDTETFFSSLYREKVRELVDIAYFEEIFLLVTSNEASLLGIIQKLAPKFEIESLPTIHTLIIMVALSEQIYFKTEEIPVSVSINEALEMTKIFSDEAGRNFVNWVLSSYVKRRGELTDIAAVSPYLFPTTVHE